jgi:antitoxin YefM
MLTTTLSDFRKDIKSYFDRVTESFDTLIINRGKDSGVVIMSLEEYNSLKSTQHELSSRKNQQRLDEIHPIVLQVLRDFPAEKLGEIYPIKIFDEEKTVSYIFIHLETHLAYHLGQINYHRRILN